MTWHRAILIYALHLRLRKSTRIDLGGGAECLGNAAAVIGSASSRTDVLASRIPESFGKRFISPRHGHSPPMRTEIERCRTQRLYPGDTCVSGYQTLISTKTERRGNPASVCSFNSFPPVGPLMPTSNERYRISVMRPSRPPRRRIGSSKGVKYFTLVVVKNDTAHLLSNTIATKHG